MRVVRNPRRGEWSELCKRPEAGREDISSLVRGVLDAVRSRGDAALREYSQKFDGAVPESFRVSLEALEEAARTVSPELTEAMQRAIENVTAFHRSQAPREGGVETSRGVECFRERRPIGRVGIYIPGGSAPLFSTLIMLAVPALVAGCKEIALLTPGGRSATIPPVIAQCVRLLGLTEVYLVGGAQAIAAMAYGTESIPKVDKICGPGNRFVTEAKMQVASEGVAIDMPAGPSEVLVIADEGANPAWVAADLLAQAEHGPDSQVVVATNSDVLLKRIVEEVATLCQELPRGAIAAQALAQSLAISFPSLGEALDFSNQYAPEHLILSVRESERFVEAIECAGSVFLGYWAAEAFGDYASGTNHVLPTNGAARAFSGVSVDTFVKKITFQRVSAAGARILAPIVTQLARAEGLEAHALAAALRGEEVQNG